MQSRRLSLILGPLALLAAVGALFLPLAGEASAHPPAPARESLGPPAHGSSVAGTLGKGVLRWMGESVAGFVGFGAVNAGFEALVGAIFGKAEPDSQKLDEIRDELKKVSANVEDLKKRLERTETNLGAQIAAVDYRLFQGQIGERVKSLETFVRLLGSAAAIGAEPGGFEKPEFTRTARELREIVTNLNRHGADIVTDRVLGTGTARGEGLLSLWSTVVALRAKATQGGLFIRTNSAQINLQYQTLANYLLIEQLARVLYERDRLGFDGGDPGEAAKAELRRFGKGIEGQQEQLAALDVDEIPRDEVLDLRADRIWYGDPSRDKVELGLGPHVDPLGGGDQSPLNVYRRATGLPRETAERALLHPGAAGGPKPDQWSVATTGQIEQLHKNIDGGSNFAGALFDRVDGGQNALFGSLRGDAVFFAAPISLSTDRKDLFASWCQSTLFCSAWLNKGLGDNVGRWWDFPDLDAGGYGTDLRKAVESDVYEYVRRDKNPARRWTLTRLGIGSRAVGAGNGKVEPTYAYRITAGREAPGADKAKSSHQDGSHYPWAAGTTTQTLREGLVDRGVVRSGKLSGTDRRSGYLLLEKPYGGAGGPVFYLR